MEIHLSDINAGLSGDGAAFVAQCEQNYWDQVHRIAEYVRVHHEKAPIILLSGPSGSGKTTTAHLLEQLLDREGLETHTVSMDNYFTPLTTTQLQDPTVDLESPNRLDKELLNAQLQSILAGETVEIPTFDFVNNERVYQGNTLTRKENELVILEGIHALNPDVITLPPENTVRIYVSVRTRLVTPDGYRLHPQWIRLMRRMLRDEAHRNRRPEDTYKMFESVNRGEDRYIMPYKQYAQFDVDTLIPYEIALYRAPLLPKLELLQQYPGIPEMTQLLRQVLPMDPILLPESSLITEFI
ncbi:MAG: nucleoside kinase [Clostridia bacterium]|nr:nucleoside kinase [Clostridia bacterium]